MTDVDMDWLLMAQQSLRSLDLDPIAIAALDRPSIRTRSWTDGGLSTEHFQDFLASCAGDLATQGILTGAKLTSLAVRRQLTDAASTHLALFAVPRNAPRLVALVRVEPEDELSRALFLLEKRCVRDERLEMTSALCEATAAAALLRDETLGETIFVSQAAFQQQGLNGPFLGLTCLARGADDAIDRLVHISRCDPERVKCHEQIGPFWLTCLSRRLGENNLIQAAARFGLTRAEQAEAESMLAGLSCKESAARLKISPETVRQRRKVIYRKLGVESCGMAVARILEIELPAPILDNSAIVGVPQGLPTARVPANASMMGSGLGRVMQ